MGEEFRNIHPLWRYDDVPLEEWFQLNIVFNAGWTYIYINEQLVGQANTLLEFEGSSDDIELWLGGFVGYIDELRISNVARNLPDP